MHLLFISTLFFGILVAVPVHGLGKLVSPLTPETDDVLSLKDKIFLPSASKQVFVPSSPRKLKPGAKTSVESSAVAPQTTPPETTPFLSTPQLPSLVTPLITAPEISAAAGVSIGGSPSGQSNGTTSGSLPPLSGNHKARAIAYSPFNSDGSCKSAPQVLSDITLLKNKGFYAVRTYDTGCSTLDKVGNAVAANGMKIIVGLWMDHAGSVDPQVQAFISWGQGNSNYNLVDILLIGNEVLYSNRDSAANLIAKIVAIRPQVVAAGYKGPIGTADTVKSYVNNPGLCASNVIDVVGLNAHPYFNSDPSQSAASSGALVQRYVGEVTAACANKNIFVTETGFPNHGNTNGGMVPSYANQKLAIDSILSGMGINVCLFTTFQDLWKQPGPYNVEQSWGMFDLTTPSNDVW